MRAPALRFNLRNFPLWAVSGSVDLVFDCRLELARERAVVRIAAYRRDVGYLVVRDEQRGGRIEPRLQQHLARRQVEHLVEVAFELRDRHPRHLCEMLQVQRLHVVILDVLDDVGEEAADDEPAGVTRLVLEGEREGFAVGDVTVEFRPR